MDYCKIKLLKELAKIQVGYALRGKIEHDPNGSISLLQMKDVQPEGILWDNLAKITPKNRKKPYLLKKDDIIFSGRGTKIFSQSVTIEPEQVTAGPQFFILKPKNQILSEYISWYINSSHGQKYFWTYAGGSSIINVTRAIIEYFPIPVPHIDDLKNIKILIQTMKRESEIITELNARRQKLLETIVSEKTEAK